MSISILPVVGAPFPLVTRVKNIEKMIVFILAMTFSICGYILNLF